jgi:hypothetical protein
MSLVGIGTLPTPLSPASVPAVGGHTRPRVRGWGGWKSPNSDDWRKSLALCLHCGLYEAYMSWTMDIAVVYSVQTCQSHKYRKGKLIFSMRAQEFTYRKGEGTFYGRGYREKYGGNTHRFMDICMRSRKG